MARGGLFATALVLAVRPADPARAADAAPRPIVLPPGNALALTVGGSRRFSATVTDENVEYRWTVDGAPAGTGRTFEYAPGSPDIGTHEIAVTVLQGPAATRHVWRVTVDPPPVPRIVDVAPSTAVVHARPGERVAFRYLVTSSVATDEVEVAWTVDGTRVGAGSAFALEVAEGGAKRVRAVASSGLGVVQAREWRVVPEGAAVAAAPAPDEIEPDEELVAMLRTMKPEREAPRATVAAPRTTTSVVRAAPATTATTAPVGTTSSTAPPRVTTSTAPAAGVATTTAAPPRVAPTTTSTAPPAAAPPSTMVVARAAVPPPPPPHPGIPRDEIVAFLERYARAYEARSVGELRRIGQVTSAEQAEALGRYFEQIRDLRVEVRVLAVEPRGDGARVRYRRRDRFRDPTGRVVEKETPPIEKEIRRTPDGLVFSPSS
ncbi:MAG TPA: hypothetical protein VF044_10050 [Actinomycetota bacterium]